MDLRCDLFKTMERDDTRFICIRETGTKPNPLIDARYMDRFHAQKGRFGLGYQFLLTVDGDIHLGRDLGICGSHTYQLDDVSVAIGIVGGELPDGSKGPTRTPEQLEALEDLLEVLRGFYPEAELDDQYA